MTPKQRSLVLYFGFVLVLAVIFVLFAKNGFPVPGGDSRTFIPPTLTYATGHGLYNLYDIQTDDFDLTGQHRWFAFPPLFPLLIGSLIPLPTAVGMFYVIGLLNVILLLSSAWIFYRLVRDRFSLTSVKNMLLLLSAILATATTLSYNLCFRFEVLGSVWVRLAILAAMYVPFRFQWLALGFCLGLMGGTHPPGALMLACVIAAYFSIRCKFWKAIRETAMTGIFSFVPFAGILLWSPLPLRDFIEGFLRHCGDVVSNRHTVFFDAAYREVLFRSTDSPLVLIVLMVTLLVCLKLYRDRREVFQSPAMFLVALTVLTAITYRLVIWFVWHYQYALMFSPLYLGVLLYAALASKRGSVWQWLPAGLLVITGLAFFRTCLLFQFYLKEGVTLAEARCLYQAIDRSMPPGTRYASSAGLWVLSEDYERLSMRKEIRLDPKSVVVTQQTYMGNNPLNDPQRVRKEDFFIYKVPAVFGIPIGRRMHGYSFAVYEPPGYAPGRHLIDRSICQKPSAQ